MCTLQKWEKTVNINISFYQYKEMGENSPCQYMNAILLFHYFLQKLECRYAINRILAIKFQGEGIHLHINSILIFLFRVFF